MEERGYNILEKHSIFAVLEKHPKNLTSFGGISGGPSFDRFGKINGVVVAEFVRRGLIGAVGIKQISWLIAASKKEAYFSKDIAILNENYLKLNIDQDRFKQIGQKLRNSGNVTQLFCIAW